MGQNEYLPTWLAPLDVGAFRDEFFSRRPLFREAGPERLGGLAELCSWDAVQLLGSRTRDVTAWFEAADGRHLTAEVAPEAARKLYQAGVTFYVKDMAELEPVRDSLARSLSVPRDNFQCNLFCNLPGATTRMHFDPVDTFTVQIKGRKRWRIAPNRNAPDPNIGWATLDRAMRAELRLYAQGPMPERMPDGAEEYLLEPGAMLYVPRGYWHETESDAESISVHIHHIVLPWVDAVLVALRSKLIRDPAWRATAATLWDPSRRPAAEAALEPLLASLGAAVAELAPGDVLPAPPRPPGPVRDDDRFRRRAMACFFVEAGPEGAKARHVTFSAVEQGTERRTTVEMSESYLAACRLFTGPTPPALGARDVAARVPGLDAAEARELVALLLDVGFLRPA
jgi:50S ribosomal protein L16 3-hydroxylase